MGLALSPQMEAALSAGVANLFGAVRMDLKDGRVVRLLDGSAELTWGGDTYRGEDAVFGVLDSIDTLTDAADDQAPSLAIGLLPASGVAATQLSAPAMQGSRVQVFLGAWVPATGAVVPSPVALFDGELDTTEIKLGKGTRRLDIECVSGFERFFELEEGARLSDGFHKSVWPGEEGLANVTGVTATITWGGKPPSGTVASGGGLSGGGFGGAAGRLANGIGIQAY